MQFDSAWKTAQFRSIRHYFDTTLCHLDSVFHDNSGCKSPLKPISAQHKSVWQTNCSSGGSGVTKPVSEMNAIIWSRVFFQSINEKGDLWQSRVGFKKTLGLTGVTVNAMALIAPGAFLWLTYQMQAAQVDLAGQTTAMDMFAGLFVALILAFLTAISYSKALGALSPGRDRQFILLYRTGDVERGQVIGFCQIVQVYRGMVLPSLLLGVPGGNGGNDGHADKLYIPAVRGRALRFLADSDRSGIRVPGRIYSLPRNQRGRPYPV